MRATVLLFLFACATTDDAKDPVDDTVQGDTTPDTVPDDTVPDVEPTFDCVTGDLGSDLGSRLVNESNAGATDDLDLSCASGTGGVDLVYTWQARTTACFQFSTEGSAIDTVVALREHCDGADLVCNDNLDDDEVVSTVSALVEAGESRVVVIDGQNAQATGNVVMHVLQFPALIADEDLGSATGAAVTTGSNAAADSTVDPFACADRSGNDVIFSWTAPQAGTAQFSTTGSFDATLSLHRVCGSSALTCVSAPGGTGSTSLDVQAGEEIYIRIGGWSSSGTPATGSYTLDITF